MNKNSSKKVKKKDDKIITQVNGTPTIIKSDNKVDMTEKYKKFITSYKTVKCALDKIIIDKYDHDIINNAVLNMNKIIIHTYSFFKLYYLNKYHNNLQLPTINKELFKCIMKTLCIKNSAGAKMNDTGRKIMDDLNDFYISHYKNLMKNEQLSYTCLGNVLEYESISITTGYENHITNHFYQFLSRYINVIMYKYEHIQSIKQYYQDKCDLLKPINTPENKMLKEQFVKKQTIALKRYYTSIKLLISDLYYGRDECPAYLNVIKNKIRKDIFKYLGYNDSLLKLVKTNKTKKVHELNFINEFINNGYTIMCNDEEFNTFVQSDYNYQLNILKNDIINNDSSCSSYFVDIKNKVNSIKHKIKYMATIENVIYKDPIKLFPYMIQMSLEIEKHNQRTFSCFSLRTNIRPKYIILDTTTIIQLLFGKYDCKTNYLENGNLKKNEKDIWRIYFNTEKKEFRKKNYVFNHQIQTDGYGCSLLLIRKDLYNTENKTKVFTIKKPFNYKSERYVTELTEEEKEKYKNHVLVGIDPGKSDLIYATDGTFIHKKNENGKVITNKKRCYKKNNKKPHTFRYTNNQRKKESKSKKYMKKIEDDKLHTKVIINEETTEFKTVKELENELCLNNLKSLTLKQVLNYNLNKKLLSVTKYRELNKLHQIIPLSVYTIAYSKTSNYKDALKYINKKNEINNYLYSYYEKKLYRTLNWYGYINKQRSEAKMVNNFKKTFGNCNKVLICYGDWSQSETMKNQEPTKGKSIRKLFKDAGYELFLVNEFNTSKMNYLMNCEMETFKKIQSPKPNRQGNYQLCHGLLRSKIFLESDLTKHKLMNRDLNGSLNIRYKAECAINNRELPKCLTRKKKSVVLHRQPSGCPK